MKQLESALEKKAQETNVLGARLEQQQLEFVRERETMLHRDVVDSYNQENEIEGPLAEFDRLLDGNETLKNQLRSLPWRLSH